MQRCYTCGGELPPQARFCSSCGSAQEEMARSDEQTRISNLNRERQPPAPGRQAAMSGMATPVLNNGPVTPAPYPPGVPGVAGTPGMNMLPTLTGTPTPPVAPGQVRLPPAAGRAAQGAVGKTAGGVALNWPLLLLAAIVVVGGIAGTLLYVQARPQPIIVLRSSYHVGSTQAGAIGTSLQFTGQHFSGNSAMTFLLDNGNTPGAPVVASDAQGNVSAQLPITAAWPAGRHQLNARDAGGNSPQTGVTIQVVTQGQAHTPGPFGAPPDDASFQVSIQFQGAYAQGGGQFSGSDTEIVSGRPDPTGGHVCQPQDNGQPHRYTNRTLDTGLPETQTVVYSCTGTYRGGTLNLTETLLSDTVQLTDQGAQITCHLLHPGIDEQLTGTYTAQGKFSGTLKYPGIPRSDFSCTRGPFASFYFFLYSGSGTWTGMVSTL